MSGNASFASSAIASARVLGAASSARAMGSETARVQATTADRIASRVKIAM